jgi:ribosomal-protein-alanine N-acetyltransferase
VEELILREFNLEDAHELLRMNIDNKEHFEKWMPVMPAPTYYTLEGQIEKIKSTQEKSKNDEYYSFGIFLEDTNSLIGNVSFSFVQRGPHQSCMIGYNLAKQHTGKGYGTAAVKLALDIAFNKLNFHRVRAEAQPENIGSLRVLEKAGFSKEGLLRKNLLVNNEWRDHVCLAILKEDVL